MATAVTYRHGTQDENKQFTGGVTAEITVDTDRSTLFIHKGDGSNPTPLAREDLDNVDPTSLTSINGKFSLLKTDLTNFSRGAHAGDYAGYIENNQNKELGKAIAEYLDIPTQGDITDKGFAKADMSNINTKNLATGRTGESGDLNLAYMDLSNVNTSSLGGTGSSATGKTAQGTALAYNDLSNISNAGKTVIQNQIDLTPYATTSSLQAEVSTLNAKFNDYQPVSQKALSITNDNDDNNHYPTNKAVTDYIADNIMSDFASNSLSNITNWDMAIADTPVYKYKVTIVDGGSNYTIGNTITTDISFIDPDTGTTDYVELIVYNVSSGAITEVVANPALTDTALPSAHSFTDPTKGAEFSIITEIQGQPGHLLNKTIADGYYAPKIATANHIADTVIHVTSSDKSTWSGKQNAITSSNKLSASLVSGLANVATSGSYSDLSNKPTIGDGTITVQKNSTTVKTFKLNDTSDTTVNITVPTTVAELTDSSNYVLNSSLKTVATSGSYTDLTDKPTIPAAQVNSDWNASSGVAQILNKPNVVVKGDVTDTYSTTTSTSIPITGAAVESQHFVRGTSDANSQTAPTHIAVYATDALALAASQSHPTWVCFSLGQ